MHQMDILIEFKHISKTFASVKALRDLNFNIEKGCIHALMGENGAGKSTLIKILAGVYEPDPGAEIYIEGKQMPRLTPLQSVREGIAVTYQDFSLFPNLTVAENIAISAAIESNSGIINWKDLRRQAQMAFDRVGFQIDLDVQLGQLSAAKQQLVAIARALMYNAKILILDEPTSTLSNNEVRNLFDIIRKLKSEGLSILFISHKIDEVFEIADKITVLRDGTYIGTYDKAEVTSDDIISYMVGRNVQYSRNVPAEPSKEVVLEVEHLSKKNNFEDISFQLHRGEILTLTGLVGAGRTELCQAIYGIHQPDTGRILLENKEVHIGSAEEASHHGIAFVPEDRRTQGLITRKSVQDNISLPILRKLRNCVGMVNTRMEKELAVRYIEQLRIKPPIPSLVSGNLSGGNQQRVVIAKCLALNPKVLIIDEPTNGIDIGAKQEIHTLLRQLAEQGMAIIMISSELPEVMALSNRILVMRRGRIVACFRDGEATESTIMHKAIL